MSEYYDRRAPEYESIYARDDAVRRAEQESLATAIREAVRDRDVLDVACGTGYWTKEAATTARSVVGVDASSAMLDEARAKQLGRSVRFVEADVWDLATVTGLFHLAFSTFFISHVPRAQLAAFLDLLETRVRSRGEILLADNVFVPGVGGELVRRPGERDTWKLRTLADGSEHEVLKNYWDEEELRAWLSPRGSAFDLVYGQCFWWARYALR